MLNNLNANIDGNKHTEAHHTPSSTIKETTLHRTPREEGEYIGEDSEEEEEEVVVMETEIDEQKETKKNTKRPHMNGRQNTPSTADHPPTKKGNNKKLQQNSNSRSRKM